MKYYDYLQLSAWQELSDDKKLALFEDALKPTFETRHVLSAVYLVNLKMGEAICRTLAMELAGQTFYFVPGQEGVKLGREELASDVCLKDKEKKHSSTRTVTIEPMFVAKDAKPVGVKNKGSFNIVTGEYSGNDRAFFELNQQRIKKELCPELDFEASLTWQYPPCVLARNLFFMEQDEGNLDTYHLFAYEDTSYSDVWLEVYSDGFQLLSEDAWEYVFAAKINSRSDFVSHQSVLLHDNEKDEQGLIPEVSFNHGNNPEKFELLAETGIMKPVVTCQLTGEFKTAEELSERVSEDIPKSNAPLPPNRFNYRAAIVFTIK